MLTVLQKRGEKLTSSLKNLYISGRDTTLKEVKAALKAIELHKKHYMKALQEKC
jgi:hypothetical protein